MSSDRLIFFGTDQFSLPVLEKLLECGYQFAAVVTRPDRPAGRGRSSQSPPLKLSADRHGLSVLQPDKVAQITSDLQGLGAAGGVVASYGKLIPQPVLSLFPNGLLNIHPSLLPRYRGPSPIEAAILNGDDKTGVSIMALSAEMDAGPIYAQIEVELTGHETRPELYGRLSKLGADLLAQHLPDILRGGLQSQPQNEAGATHTKLIQKSDGQINWQLPADQIQRHIRAYLGWPGSFCQLAGLDVTITAARVEEGESRIKNHELGVAFPTQAGELAVACGKGTLVIDRLKPAAKREMSGREFLAGHRL